jgi:hypothetical protein
MSMLPRKCAGCGQRKRNCDTPVGVSSWYCDDCNVWAGINGTNRRLKNLAEEQSRKWKEGPCKHQSFSNVPYKDPATGRRGQKSVCNNPNCGAEIYNVLL